MLSLDRPPADVTDGDLWREGQPGDLAVGDLWLLSWDGRALALALASGVASDYALVWPVTLPSEIAFQPAIEVPTSPLDTRVLVWPSRETGVGLHLFHRRFGTLLRERTMALMIKAGEAGKEPPYPYAPPRSDDKQTESWDEAMVDAWEDICLNVWPKPLPGETPLNRAVLRAIGVRPSNLAALLGVATSDAAGLFLGETNPTHEQVEALADHFEIGPEELLRTYTDEAVAELIRPAWKDHIVAISQRYSEGEEAARTRLRTEFALAARATGTTRDRMRAALGRLLERDRR